MTNKSPVPLKITYGVKIAAFTKSRVPPLASKETGWGLKWLAHKEQQFP